MATLNGQYLFVKKEDITYGVDAPSHTVETGVDVSDHVKRRAATLSISGEIVGENAAGIASQLKQLHQKGAVCKYVGSISFANCLITDFSTSYSSDIWGGCSFSMTLKEVRTASTSFATATAQVSASFSMAKNTGTQQVTKKSKVTYVYHKVKKGDTVWALVAAPKAPYKKYGLSCNDVMKLNPKAFSRAGDFGTLKIGYKLIVGKR